MGFFTRSKGKSVIPCSSASSSIRNLDDPTALIQISEPTDAGMNAFAAAAASGNRLNAMSSSNSSMTRISFSDLSIAPSLTSSMYSESSNFSILASELAPASTSAKKRAAGNNPFFQRLSKGRCEQKMVESYADYMIEYWPGVGTEEEEGDEQQALFDTDLNRDDDEEASELIENTRGSSTTYDLRARTNRGPFRRPGGDLWSNPYPSPSEYPSQFEFDDVQAVSDAEELLFDMEEQFTDEYNSPKSYADNAQDDSDDSFIHVDLLSSVDKLNSEERQRELRREVYRLFGGTNFLPGLDHLTNPLVCPFFGYNLSQHADEDYDYEPITYNDSSLTSTSGILSQPVEDKVDLKDEISGDEETENTGDEETGSKDHPNDDIKSCEMAHCHRRIAFFDAITQQEVGYTALNVIETAECHDATAWLGQIGDHKNNPIDLGIMSKPKISVGSGK